MKTLSILFSEPNVFSVLPTSTCVYCGTCKIGECEQSKANAIRIENPEILPFTNSFQAWFYLTDQHRIQNGDIFQVDGFEYEVKELGSVIQTYAGCDYNPKKVAILKLAKEEEPKEDKRRWPAIRAEEKISEYRDKNAFSVIDSKSEFCYGFRMCLQWIQEEYDITPKELKKS